MLFNTFLIIFANSVLMSNQLLNQFNCGLSAHNFVIGGDNATEGEFPFLASLQTPGGHFCTAAILDAHWVLSAAHCFRKRMNKTNLSALKVAVGSVDKTSPKKIYQIQTVVSHGCFYKSFVADDVALVKTKEPIDIDNRLIGTICLPPKDKEPVSNVLTQVAGWGVFNEEKTRESMAYPKILQKAVTEVKPESYCQLYAYFKNVGASFGTVEMGIDWSLGTRHCIEYRSNTVCFGDSGGPLFQRINGKFYHFGICSFGADFELGQRFWGLFWTSMPCYKSNPALYQKTVLYHEWIDKVVEKYNSATDYIITECDSHSHY